MGTKSFTFFGNGHSVKATPEMLEVSNKCHSEGRRQLDAGNFPGAKSSFKMAFYMAKACFEQFNKIDKSKAKSLYDNICKDLGETYRLLGNNGKAETFNNFLKK
jgi:hypothetical protein